MTRYGSVLFAIPSDSSQLLESPLIFAFENRLRGLNAAEPSHQDEYILSVRSQVSSTCLSLPALRPTIFTSETTPR